MESGEGNAGNGRPAVTTEGQTEEQRRLARQAERIRELERLMRGAAAFSRRGTE